MTAPDVMRPSDELHRLRVALAALVNEWRYQADHLTDADFAKPTPGQRLMYDLHGEARIERENTLRECAYDLEERLTGAADDVRRICRACGGTGDGVRDPIEGTLMCESCMGSGYLTGAADDRP